MYGPLFGGPPVLGGPPVGAGPAWLGGPPISQGKQYPEKVRGFRFDGIRANGSIGFYGAPESDLERYAGRRPQTYEYTRWTPSAFCVVHGHAAPDPDCKCGWYVTPNIRELVEYTTWGYGLDVSLTTVDKIEHRPVIVEVIAHGPKEEPGRSDPESSLRAAWVSLAGRAWIRDDVPDKTIRNTRKLWPWLKIERFSDLSEVPDMVEGSKQST